MVGVARADSSSGPGGRPRAQTRSFVAIDITEPAAAAATNTTAVRGGVPACSAHTPRRRRARLPRGVASKLRGVLISDPG